MQKVYFVGGKWSTVGDKLLFDIQEQEFCRAGFVLTGDMKNADVVIIGCGGTLYSREGRYSEEYQGKILDYPLKDLLEARDKGKPIYVLGAGFQQFRGALNEAAWREVLLAAKSISVRDNMSKEALQQLIGFEKEIKVWPDVAFSLNILPTEPTYKNTLGIIIAKESYFTDERRQRFENFLTGLSPVYNFLWIPFDLDEYKIYTQYWIPKFGGSLSSDELFAGQHLIPNVGSSIGAIQACSGIITTRLHATLLSIMVNRPVLNLGGNKIKIQGQVRDLFPSGHYAGLVSLDMDAQNLTAMALHYFKSHANEELFKQIYDANKVLCMNHFNILKEI